MDHTADVTGEMVQGDRPDWDPLSVQAIITRDYLHLTHEGRAFVFRPEHSYREVDLEEAVAGLFARWWSLKAPPAPPG